jgi:hypothetical protein
LLPADKIVWVYRKEAEVFPLEIVLDPGLTPRRRQMSGPEKEKVNQCGGCQGRDLYFGLITMSPPLSENHIFLLS